MKKTPKIKRTKPSFTEIEGLLRKHRWYIEDEKNFAKVFSFAKSINIHKELHLVFYAKIETLDYILEQKFEKTMTVVLVDGKGQPLFKFIFSDIKISGIDLSDFHLNYANTNIITIGCWLKYKTFKLIKV